MINNIPSELKELRQFICWKYEDRGGDKPTKVPYNPLTNFPASVMNRSHWVSFQDALNNVGNYEGIGFVISEDDPFTFIDLDDAKSDTDILNTHKELVKSLDSYTEISPSGNGVHIIVKSNVAGGRRNKKTETEIYSKERYMTMTGNVFLDKPVQYRHDEIRKLLADMAPIKNETTFEGSSEEKITDDELMTMASNASNGSNFDRLFSGDYANYPSQSEADLAIINMIAFYTDNKEQVARIFRTSELGQRAKAQRHDIVNGMIHKAFDQKVPEINFDKLRDNLNATVNMPNNMGAIAIARYKYEHKKLPSNLPAPKRVIEKGSIYDFPPGLVGDIAEYIFSTAQRPVKEIALSGALALMAGITGRAYNVSDTGLNNYFLLLANTGVGKDAVKSGIGKLMMHVQMRCTDERANIIGPANIASGPALIKHLANQNSFVSIFGEFGISMRNMHDQRANAAQLALRQSYLDLYSRSGKDQTLDQTVYSDKDKNTEIVKSPAFSFFAEAQPKSFYEIIDETMIESGFLPRLNIIEYTGKRVPQNFNNNTPPTNELITTLSDLCGTCMRANNISTPLVVNLDAGGIRKRSEIEKLADDTINNAIENSNAEIILQLWNRVSLKTLKLAALIAVGKNMYAPLITESDMEWAFTIVKSNTKRLTDLYMKGEMGAAHSDVKQLNAVQDVIRNYLLRRDTKNVRSDLFNDKIIPHSHLIRSLLGRTSFKKDRAGATNALRKTINTMIENNELVKVPVRLLKEKYGITTGLFYMVSDPTILEQ